MKPVKTFNVLGETVEILVTGESTNHSFCMLVQTSPPGGGPPPHSHKFEDEIFTVVEGEFELFDGKQWNKVPPGEQVHALRNQVHTFRNCGKTPGKIHCVAIDGRLDEYLEAISPLRLPEDMARLLEISSEYGITFAAP
ncbi:MAG: cupin domain-containing protein [Acidobacteria bacterium]|nr:cupin domain-containing protein [Acidobacteriota bacterium]